MIPTTLSLGLAEHRYLQQILNLVWALGSTDGVGEATDHDLHQPGHEVTDVSGMLAAVDVLERAATSEGAPGTQDGMSVPQRAFTGVAADDA